MTNGARRLVALVADAVLRGHLSQGNGREPGEFALPFSAEELVAGFRPPGRDLTLEGEVDRDVVNAGRDPYVCRSPVNRFSPMRTSAWFTDPVT